MNNEDIKDLLLKWRNATINEESQEIINEYAVKLTDILYDEKVGKTYDQLLKRFRYKEQPQHKFYKKRFNKKD